MSNEWKERSRPARLEKRYEFDSYEELRTFLDDAADLSEKENLYPDLGFTRDYVNITIYPDPGSEALTDRQHSFAKSLDDLL